MPLSKMTPTHKTIETIKKTIKLLQLQLDALYATLPEEKEDNTAESRVIVHPLTKKQGTYEYR